MSNASANAVHEFECPLCSGSFEVETQWLGQAIPCPHCGQDVELPSAAELMPAGAEPVPPPASQPAAAASGEAPARRLTVAERAELRRKINLSLAISGALLLIVVFVVLAQFG